jgi:hypothetical protein
MDGPGMQSHATDVRARSEAGARASAVELRTIEPRRVMWAVAEVSWNDPNGRPLRSRATIVDLSTSGACIRLKDPIRIGCRLTIRWHREQFSAIARNCRSDGMDFLLGVRRDPSANILAAPASVLSNPAVTLQSSTGPSESAAAPGKKVNSPGNESRLSPVHAETLAAPNSPLVRTGAARIANPTRSLEAEARRRHVPDSMRDPPAQGSLARSPRRERKVMQPKRLFPNFWRRQPASDAPKPADSKETPVNKTSTHAAESELAVRSTLLSYEDIYHAAGIMSPRSGYGIHKVVDMLNSERIRDLSKEIKRASVLMALDAAGASVDELLQDANRRQHALNTYEDAQRKQFEDFETRKAQENAQIQTEIERITAHYAERVQQNKELVAKEKEALHNWQMAKQHESQRISEVIELCGKQDAVAAAAAAAGAQASTSALPRPNSGSETK